MTKAAGPPFMRRNILSPERRIRSRLPQAMVAARKAAISTSALAL
jgi:hypothetical protein